MSEFFKKATGKSAEKFATLETFDINIKSNAGKIAGRGEQAFTWGINALLDFYSRNEFSTFRYAKETGGMKLVLGGGSRFTKSHLNAVRKMLLYTDTILIPDPVLPWIEVERSEEKFQHVNLLKNIFILLHLKPLVDADLTYPAIIVFPSFEKRLEANDPETKKGVENLLLNFLSFHTGYSFNSISSVFDFARTNEHLFLYQVEKHRLFISPGGKIGTPLKKAIKEYRKDIKTWRSEELANVYLNSLNGPLILTGIWERITPQWHLLENANELHSQPMMCVDAHWHYYKLCSKMFENNLLESNLLKPKTVNTLRALADGNFEWLGNVPIEALAKLRENNENEEFRKKISGFVTELHDSTIDDIDRVAAEVGRGISSVLSENKKKIQEIETKYRRLYEQTAIASWVTLGATFIPSLAPFAAAVPVLAGKYAWDKIGEIRDKKQVSQSLMGVLASANTTK